MQDQLIIIIVLILILAAAGRIKKRLRGGCCGSGSQVIRDKKVLDAPVIGIKLLTVEGMHCENCAIRVENAVNRLDGALCRVDLKRKTAAVSYSAEIPDALLRETVERLGYQVTAIRS